MMRIGEERGDGDGADVGIVGGSSASSGLSDVEREAEESGRCIEWLRYGRDVEESVP